MPLIIRILVLSYARSLPKTMSSPVAVVKGININWQTLAVNPNAIR